ncbi:tyrosyl-DNA phosphodiesterase 1-like [Actinia tenebrosa]|uniref:Tyrosyl-DNA phosphodiesterase 1-like n=1 Tax=Actinia tenebrosa TaxID=6105 RepID=A0A6P8HLV0_ACTTE|nr:tyrosyl-DNA phosphodiesterase 1-like [Actinia tenebrosa]
MMSSPKDERPVCKYGSKCYRKNPLHLEEYRHPNERDDDSDDNDNSPPRKRHRSSSPKRIESSSPENKLAFYFTKVRGIPAKYNDDNIAVGIKDLLSHKMGDLQASVQFNYMIDIPWLMQQYPQDKRSKPLLIVHGSQGQSKTEMIKDAEQFPNIKFFQARLEAYGTHHSKMMLLLYSDGLRVVITTANLIIQDWDQKTQGVWISPKFPKISSSEGSSASSSAASTSQATPRRNTNFKKDLLEYLCAYGGTALDEWKKDVRQHDMSSARVHLIASVPGRHSGSSKSKWGHLKLRKVLQEHGPSSANVSPSWPVIGQFSSIGSLGNDKSKWLCGEWLQSLAVTSGRMAGSNSPLKLVFPSVDDVRMSLEGYPAGGSIPYSHKTAAKQPYLPSFFCRWKSNSHGRSRASPHIKSYIRVSPDTNKLAWFMVTSCNLSKAAWGVTEKNGSQLMIRSYEIGVLFLPKNQEPNQDFFSIHGHTHAQSGSSIPVPVPFDLPLTPYSKDDKPWMWDVRHTDKPDTHGNIWSPS